MVLTQKQACLFALIILIVAAGCEGPETGTSLPDSGASKPGSGGMGGGGACLSYSEVSDESLLFFLHDTMQRAYTPIDVEPDQGGTPNRYTTARRLMFTDIERKRGPQNGLVSECIYTGETASQPRDDEPDRSAMIGERLWPKSRLFEDQESPLFKHQDADLHHLRPATPAAEANRNDLTFGNVAGAREANDLPSFAGPDSSGTRVFEVRRDRKGDVARAMMYMSVRWGLEIPKREADTLRAWHELDPVSTEESLRNTEVQRLQGNRNPFVDCPDLVSRIRAFTSFRPYDLNYALPDP